MITHSIANDFCDLSLQKVLQFKNIYKMPGKIILYQNISTDIWSNDFRFDLLNDN